MIGNLQKKWLKILQIHLPTPIHIENNLVYADVNIYDNKLDLWKGRFDNWCIQFDDNKDKFKLCSIEVF